MSSPSAQLGLFDAAPPSLREVADVLRTAGIGGLDRAQRRADAATYQEVHVKSALAAAQGMPFRWSLNPYRGCTHACEYCYARKYQRHLELGAGDDFSSMIFVKTNLAAVLTREVTRRTWQRETVAVGTATDPYQPIEGRYQLTRQALAILGRHGTPFTVVTKGPMAVRDVDVLRAATRGAGCRVFFSVPSVDLDAWARLEPGTASPQQRLRAARVLADAGVDTGVLMMPLMPGITTSRASVEATLTAIADAGVRFAGACVARLDAGVRDHVLSFLDREYPDLVAGYARLFPGAHARASYSAGVRAQVRQAADRVSVLRAAAGSGA